MTPTDEIRARLDELGIEHYDHENGEPLRDLSEAGADPATSWRMGGASVCAVPNKQGTFDLWIDNCTPEQVIAATVGRRDAMELWPEWEQVLFANVSDEVAQDNLNECVHELLEKAAMVGAGTCTMEPDGYYGEQYGIYKCSNCGELWQFVCDGPKENHWTCCPHCMARIEEGNGR